MRQSADGLFADFKKRETPSIAFALSTIARRYLFIFPMRTATGGPPWPLIEKLVNGRWLKMSVKLRPQHVHMISCMKGWARFTEMAPNNSLQRSCREMLSSRGACQSGMPAELRR